MVDPPAQVFKPAIFSFIFTCSLILEVLEFFKEESYENAAEICFDVSPWLVHKMVDSMEVHDIHDAHIEFVVPGHKSVAKKSKNDK